MARRRRSPFGLWSMLALVGLLLAERRLSREALFGRDARRPGWWLISRELLLRRLGFYSPTGIFVRLAAAIVRRFTGRGRFGGGFAAP
jgi:hypothetical protein